MSRFDVSRFDVGRFDVGRLDVGRLDVGRFNVGRFNVGGFEGGRFGFARFGGDRIGETGEQHGARPPADPLEDHRADVRCSPCAAGRESGRRKHGGVDRAEPRRPGKPLIGRGSREQPRAVRGERRDRIAFRETEKADPLGERQLRADWLGCDDEDTRRACELEARAGAGERGPGGSGKAPQPKQPRAALFGKAFGEPLDVPAHRVADGEPALEEGLRARRAERRTSRRIGPYQPRTVRGPQPHRHRAYGVGCETGIAKMDRSGDRLVHDRVVHDRVIHDRVVHGGPIVAHEQKGAIYCNC